MSQDDKLTWRLFDKGTFFVTIEADDQRWINAAKQAVIMQDVAAFANDIIEHANAKR